MLNTKFQRHRSIGSREENFTGFTIYGCAGQTDHVSWTD